MNHPDKTNLRTPDIENVNVTDFDSMPSPEEIHAAVPLSPHSANTVMRGREAVRNILDHKDNRLLVIVGPCSIHDPVAGMDYARRLKALADDVSDTLCIVMRVYFEKPRTTTGWKGYITNLANRTPEYVIGAYHQLWQVEKSFRMSKSDLKARPVYHHLKDSIEAHLTIVFAALAVARWLESTTGVSIKALVKTLRRHRTIDIQAGDTIVTAENALPDDAQAWLDAIHQARRLH